MVYTSSNARAMSKSLHIANKHQPEQKKKPQNPTPNHYYQFQQQQRRAAAASQNGGIYMSSLYNDRSIGNRTKSNYGSANLRNGNNYGDDSEVEQFTSLFFFFIQFCI